jgi:catechol 2,3-dioxygenase-like lactoylglutathione lyase family enzyme
MKPLTTLRVARPTNDFDAVVRFYREGLGLSELYRFENHDGFDGACGGGLMRPIIEFTRAHGHNADRAPTEDNLIVFYFPDRGDWEIPSRA